MRTRCALHSRGRAQTEVSWISLERFLNPLETHSIFSFMYIFLGRGYGSNGQNLSKKFATVRHEKS
jgi:hypothetical protein